MGMIIVVILVVIFIGAMIDLVNGVGTVFAWIVGGVIGIVAVMVTGMVMLTKHVIAKQKQKKK